MVYEVNTKGGMGEKQLDVTLYGLIDSLFFAILVFFVLVFIRVGV